MKKITTFLLLSFLMSCSQNDMDILSDISNSTITKKVNNLWKWVGFYENYGGEEAIPVPADYDGDGKADLSVKCDDGTWYIDYAENGFGKWDWQSKKGTYGGSNSIPVPADYDGDGKADLSIKDENGTWYIDYAANGFGKWDWQSKKGSYGGENSIPVPADYDGDGKTDLSVVNKDTGIWYVDYAANGFGKWDQKFRGNYANQYSKYFLPGDYDGDGILDLSCIVPGGGWNIASSLYSSTFGLRTITSSHIPTPADYDGDGILDMSYKLNPLNYDDNPYGTWVIFYSGEKP